MKDLNELFIHYLQDVYYAERQALRTYPKLIKATQNEELKQALLHHREETQTQIERLQQVFELIGKRARGITCEAMNGLIEESQELLEEVKEAGAVRDAGLIASAQAIEHYEIARYGTMLAWAKALGHNEIASLLEETLKEERKTDELLNRLANQNINQAAKKAA